MNVNEVKDLVNTINLSALVDFELKLDNAYIKMSKLGFAESNKSDTHKPENTKVEISSVKTESKIKTAIETEIEEPITFLPEDKPLILEGHIIYSPIVGTFYESATPENPPFVKVGARVKKGDILCIVEAMKIMNEITSNVDGELVEILVENEAMVEYNQPLFRII